MERPTRSTYNRLPEGALAGWTAGDGMAEPPTSSADPAAPRERDQLLATKLSIPRPRPDRLTRSRLRQRLDEGLGQALILVCTPAGFGKTTLLADWATSTAMPVAWLSLDPDDNDPARFWRYVVAALERAGVPVAERVGSLSPQGGEASSHAVVTALINQLEALPDEVALALDDYHVIESASIHDGVAFLLNHLPPQLHLVIAGRSDPPLQLARLRAAGRLCELRAADLRFTPEETAAFLRDLWGLDLAPEAVTSLESRTEGWAVGLQLAALSLKDRPDPEGFLDAFTGTHRFILDYLSEEVLELQPQPVRAFLLQTSILERLSGPLCDAVTGTSGGQDTLEALERANLFLISLDEERRWYRFHHLFADLLRASLQRSHPELVPELHRRAADWCQQHGLIDDAIRHRLGSRDAPSAARLVEEHLDDTLRRGEDVILQRWLSALPEEAVKAVPALCLAQGLMEFHLGHLHSVERLLEHAERAFDPRRQPPRPVRTTAGMVAELPAAIALLRAELAALRGDSTGTSAYARAALAEMAAEEHAPRFWARWLLAFAAWMGGRMEDAERALAELIVEGRATADLDPVMSTGFTLARVQRARGRLGAALRTCQDGLRFATEGGRLTGYQAGEPHVGIAEVLYERDELDLALEHVTRGIELCRQVLVLRKWDRGLCTLGWIRQAMGEAGAALEAMEEACRLYPTVEVASLFNPAPAERARLLLAQGRVEEAARWTEERGLSDDDEVSYPRERDHLVLARVLLARAEPARALGLLDRLKDLAEFQGRTGSVIEIRALRALARQAAGDHQGALTAVAEALSLARPERFVRVFADEGPPMAALLKSLMGARRGGRAVAGSGAAQEHLNRVVQAFAPAGPRGTTAAAGSGLIEPLTARELEVLSLIAAGRRNREIANDLVVTVETVKKHTSHIFDKLGAANRTQAVTRARQLGLVP
jgi:LuxR family transcriptional regulator, maltose regulon positive regulatory protein